MEKGKAGNALYLIDGRSESFVGRLPLFGYEAITAVVTFFFKSSIFVNVQPSISNN